MRTAKFNLIAFILLMLINGCGGDKPSTNTTTTELKLPSTQKASSANSATPNLSNLTIQEALLAKKTPNGKLVSVDDGIFKRGEDIYLVLLKVGKFKKGQDGKHRFDMSMSVKDPKGKVLLSKASILGEKGHTLLPGDTAASPYASVNTSITLEPGKYELDLTVHDKLAGAKVSETKFFTLK